MQLVMSNKKYRVKSEFNEPIHIGFRKQWDKIGKRDTYKCPECEYLGRMCDKCKDKRGNE